MAEVSVLPHPTLLRPSLWCPHGLSWAISSPRAEMGVRVPLMHSYVRASENRGPVPSSTDLTHPIPWDPIPPAPPEAMVDMGARQQLSVLGCWDTAPGRASLSDPDHTNFAPTRGRREQRKTWGTREAVPEEDLGHSPSTLLDRAGVLCLSLGSSLALLGGLCGDCLASLVLETSGLPWGAGLGWGGRGRGGRTREP